MANRNHEVEEQSRNMPARQESDKMRGSGHEEDSRMRDRMGRDEHRQGAGNMADGDMDDTAPRERRGGSGI